MTTQIVNRLHQILAIIFITRDFQMSLTSLQNYTFQVCIATIWKRYYDGMNKQSLQLMTSVLAKYILQLGKIAAVNANYAGRCDVQLDDVLWALEEVGVDFHDLLSGRLRQDSMYEFVDVDEELPMTVPKTRTTDENMPYHLPAYPEKDAVKTSYTPAQVEMLPIKSDIEDLIIKDAPPIPPRINNEDEEMNGDVKKVIFEKKISQDDLLQSLYDCMNEAELENADKSEEMEERRKKIKLARKQTYMDAIKRHPLLDHDIGTHADHFQFSTLFPSSPFFEMPNDASLDTSARTSSCVSKIPPGWLLAPQKINLRPMQQKQQLLDLNEVNDLLEDDGKTEEQDKAYRNSYVDALKTQSLNPNNAQ